MPKAYVLKTIYLEDGVRHSVLGVHESLQNGKARIGWSSKDEHDLRLLKQKIDGGERNALSPDQQEACRCLGFLNRVQCGDYLVYPHQPKPNYVLIAQVKDGPDGEYGFLPSEESLDGDFRSFRGCELLTPNLFHTMIRSSYLPFRVS